MSSTIRYIDEFRRKGPARAMLRRIEDVAPRDGVSIMEICGTHTHSISKYGIRGAVPTGIRLLSGPGCPVCVTAQADINRIVEFSRRNPSVVIATFGDMLRVPGTFSSLEKERAEGADIRVVYSPLDALEMARRDPAKEVVFYSVGFETTAPTVAATVIKARREGIGNFSVLSLHKLTPPAMKALLDSGDVNIDGFICPGHVTTIIGAGAYGFIAKDYGAPCVVAGFEPLDALYGLYMLLLQLRDGRAEIEIEYTRVVTWEGNKRAQEVMYEVFERADSRWRGLGEIACSGLRIRGEFSHFDAEKRFDMGYVDCDDDQAGCSCGEVIKGLVAPSECTLFATACTPETPMGPCMVSSEGTCAAYYRYERI